MTNHPSKIIYLGLGTNLSDRLSNLQQAITSLFPGVHVLAQSPIYETQPWGLTDQPTFLNMVLKGATHLPPLDLFEHLKSLETRLGRLPSVRWGPRLIDIDILFYSDTVLSSPQLTIPHPRLHERAFVLIPLADLAPDLLHPVLEKTIRQLLDRVDINGVKLYEPRI
jgi:2-amino-4-hydroxy-6-hydroxymethyldihydropteridine diphosphokinase